MTYVQSFSAVTPPPRYDDIAWTDLEIWESETEAGTFALIDTKAIAVDATPATPNTVAITTIAAEFAVGWYRFRFLDGVPNYSNYTDSVLAPADADGTSYFTIAELRAEHPKLDDVDKYPDVKVAAKIARAIETIERACDVAFVPREAVAIVTAAAADVAGQLPLPHNRVREVTALSASISGDLELASARIVAGGYLERAVGWPAGETVTVSYTHGYDEPPVRIHDAAMLYARTLILKGPIDDRATQLSSADGGVVNLLTPGLRGSVTGIPEVDAAIEQYQEFG